MLAPTLTSMSAPAGGRPTAHLLLTAMILAIGLGPRIRVPGLLDRAVDLRVQDLLLIPALLYVGSRTPSLRDVWGRWAAYFVVGAVTLTGIRLLLDPSISIIRSVAYLGRGIELFVLAAVVAGLFRLSGHAAGRVALRAIHAAIIGNLLWVAYQMATGANGTLLGSSVGNILDGYGPKLVGEGSAYGSGIFLAFTVAVGCAEWLSGATSRWWAGSLVAAGAVGTYLVQSRVSLAAVAACLLALLFLPVGDRRRSVSGGLSLAVVAMAIYVFADRLIPQSGRLSGGGMDTSLGDRVEGIWGPLIDILLSGPNLLVGIGVGQLGTSDYPHWVEAHNIVLRSLLDYGLPITIAYFATFATILVRVLHCATATGIPRERQLWASLCAVTIIAVTVTGALQESLSAVMSSHLLVLTVGLFAGALLGAYPDKPKAPTRAEERAAQARRQIAPRLPVADSV
jgi:hypothetical protein